MIRALTIIEALTPKELFRKLGRIPPGWPRFKTWRTRGEEKFRRGELRNVQHIKYPDKTMALRYHDTDILTYYPDGTIVVQNGGYPTVSTKDRLNNFLPNGWFVYGKTVSGFYGPAGTGEWFWGNQAWPPEMKSRMWTAYKRVNKPWFVLPYHNGDKITPSGTLIFHGGTAKPDGTIQLAGQEPVTHEEAVEWLRAHPRGRQRGPGRLELEHLEWLHHCGLISESYLERLQWRKRAQAKVDATDMADWLAKEVDPKKIKKTKPVKHGPTR